jgi:beta-phosphoglucomutase-like phosphatase (HAD superfamily)
VHLAAEFDVIVDGVEIGRLHLPGKPDPASFSEAAKRLHVASDDAIVLEDALAGVEAGRRGHFGLVIGIDRTGQADELHRHGAHLVVSDLRSLVDGNPVSSS